MMRRKTAALTLIVFLWSPMSALCQDVESVTVLIDSLTTLPIGTGLVADSADHFVVIAQGTMNLFPDLPLDDYGFDPSGKIRLLRLGQIVDQRPYGCVMGIFNPVGNFYIGDGGAMIAQPDDEGHELQLLLNMSASDLSTFISGLFAVTVMRVPAGYPVSQANVLITASTVLPVNTGLVANPGDRFLIRARGAVKTVVSYPFSDGWFDPSGLARLDRGGQLLSNVPYGSILGAFDSDLFNVGDGGTWNTQPADLGEPLLLHLNMSEADHSTMQGRFVVTVDRFASATTNVPIGSDDRFLAVGKGAPNPTASGTTIAYRASVAGRIRARIYDESGRWVRTVADETVPAGDHVLVWDGRDESGRSVSSGVYFCQVSLEDRSVTKKVTVVR
jgi:FlgD Ig-like domain